jgi:hypothetical protein
MREFIVIFKLTNREVGTKFKGESLEDVKKKISYIFRINDNPLLEVDDNILIAKNQVQYVLVKDSSDL